MIQPTKCMDINLLFFPNILSCNKSSRSGRLIAKVIFNGIKKFNYMFVNFESSTEKKEIKKNAKKTGSFVYERICDEYEI